MCLRDFSIALLLGCLALAARLPAAPPLEPLSAPRFSLRAGSPELVPGVTRPFDLLERDFGDGVANVALSGGALGLLSPGGDELDGISENSVDPSLDTFVLLFSVDDRTIGAALPDPNLVAAGVPYNVSDQAARRQAAADIFMSTSRFALPGARPSGSTGLRGPATGLGAKNNTLVLNQFDEGGTSFVLAGETSAEDHNDDPNTDSDDIDAIDTVDDPNAPTPPPGAYFTLAAGSPSLSAPGFPGSGNPSGAHVFFRAAPGDGNPPVMYASRLQLGLVTADDIDALIVLDGPPYGVYEDDDFVIFSLAPGSPSLGTIPGASASGAAADVFFRRANGGGIGLLASAAELGLGALPDRDNIDALSLRRSANGRNSALRHGIRRVRGDCGNDGKVLNADFGCLLGCWFGPGVDYDTDGADLAVVSVSGVLNPPRVLVEQGDWVLWTWTCALETHRIRSGRIGFPDGAFDSVSACPYFRPFGPAFLAAHPRAADTYRYFDSVTLQAGAVFVAPDPCARFDFDQDGDVDVADVAGFQRSFGGP